MGELGNKDQTLHKSWGDVVGGDKSKGIYSILIPSLILGAGMVTWETSWPESGVWFLWPWDPLLCTVIRANGDKGKEPRACGPTGGRGQ